ncbi:F-box/kelch-repeat protein [Citrus sinensis]|nr:F-box/kelch-repeat protein [Citrus sinensis]
MWVCSDRANIWNLVFTLFAFSHSTTSQKPILLSHFYIMWVYWMKRLYEDRNENMVQVLDFKSLSVSKRLVKSVSRKLRNKNLRNYDGDDEDDVKGVSLKCLTLYGRGVGCKVGAETGEECGDPSSRRRSSASEEGKGYKPFCGSEETGVGVDFFSYGVKEKFWKKSNSKNLELEDSVRNSRMHIFLPDDILEMCLVRFPSTSLMNDRLVCKKWRHLTTTPRFLQMRREGWLLLWGDSCAGCFSRPVA